MVSERQNEKANAFTLNLMEESMKHQNSLPIRPAMIGLVMIASLILTACASPAAATTPSVNGGETVQGANNASFGEILVTTDGRTLYTFAIDTSDESKCTDLACTRYWPPYTASADPTAGSGISGNLGTLARPDGTKQITFDGKPLYTFAVDKNPGDVKGDGLNDFGGIWNVVSLTGSTTKNSSNNSAKGGYGY
jgi:predicted lipoprotein with Yx(FWY)xxD motif